jgi:hypothetical protein
MREKPPDQDFDEPAGNQGDYTGEHNQRRLMLSEYSAKTLLSAGWPSQRGFRGDEREERRATQSTPAGQLKFKLSLRRD